MDSGVELVVYKLGEMERAGVFGLRSSEFYAVRVFLFR